MTVKKLLKIHPGLIHSENMKVVSHVQRDTDDWIFNTVMIEGYDVRLNTGEKSCIKTLRGNG